MTEAQNQIAGQRERLIVRVSQLLHQGEFIAAGQSVIEFQVSIAKLLKLDPGPPVQVTHEGQAKEYCYTLLQWCLENDRYDLAAGMLWNENLFTYKPRCTKMIWHELRTAYAIMLIGAGSMSKSYGAAVWLLLDWIRDPEYTTVKLVGPSEQHLKDNLFSHLVEFHQNATLPLPGFTRDLFIGLDSKARRGSITGVVFPIGQGKGGRLQGVKRRRRKEAHPKFGVQSRLRVLIDEFEKVPTGVLKDIDNLFSNFDGDIEGLKLITAFNPEDPSGPAAQRCEPKTGWEKFDPETDEIWDSKRGWRVLRLDAARCENVEQKKVIYPGLQTYEGFQQIIRNAGGLNSNGYWTMARACFPKAGGVFCILSEAQTNKLRGEFIFGEPPANVGAVDIALEGGDIPQMAAGRFGKAIGYRVIQTDASGRETKKEVFFKNKIGQRVLRWGLQVDQLFPLEKGDTVFVAQKIKDAALKFGIAPKNLLVDRTGNGAGVHDLLKNLWSPEVRGLNYTEAATELKILEEDTQTPLEEFERVVNELWFALKKWTEYDFIKCAPSVLSEELLKELKGRQYKKDRNNEVETKRHYKARGHSSPDRADTITLITHLVRVAFRCTPAALDSVAGVSITGRSPDDDPVPYRVDASNRFEDIDSPTSTDDRDAYGDTFIVNDW